MPFEERSGLDIVTAIARLVSEQTGRTIWVGMMPTNLMVQKSAGVVLDFSVLCPSTFRTFRRELSPRLRRL